MDFETEEDISKFRCLLIDYLGVIGTFIRESKIIETIDKLIPIASDKNSYKLTHGQVIALFITQSLTYKDHLVSDFGYDYLDKN